MDSLALAALLSPFAGLGPEILEQTSRYLDLLLRWNAKVNLTAVRRPEEIVQRHFGESFFTARTLFPQPQAEAVIDVGSGAGFPGLPLAMFVPEAKVTLIEADSRKAAFLNEVIRALGLRNATVFNRRAEAYPAAADLVTMRAVEKFEKSLKTAAALVARGGRIALMIGAAQVEQARSGSDEILWQAPQPMPGGKARVLAVGIKSVIVPDR